MSAPTEPVWKRWLDRLLMVNVLLVFIGAGSSPLPWCNRAKVMTG